MLQGYVDSTPRGLKGQRRGSILWSPSLFCLTTAASMEPIKPNPDELLSKYEAGVWIFLAPAALAILGLIFWLGYMVLL